uniref:Pentatricopeptide repeat-containing protein n=1 Tax=Nelumbo nucifera TaxID=4432 RepID=A0A822ZS84_NELNU|nr:TPA_asm: hypothetical protein HUJ06_017287 [Nelumbo nucifera]
MKHVRDVTLLPNVIKWRYNMEASMRDPQNRQKDFTPMFPSEGSISEIMSFIASLSKDADIDSQIDSENGRSQSEDETSSSIDHWSSSPYVDQLANEVKSTNYSQLFSKSKGRRVQGRSNDSFDIDMINTFLSVFLAKGKLSFACKLFEIFTEMGANPVSYITP